MGETTNGNNWVHANGMSTYPDTIKTEAHYATMDDVTSEMKAKFAQIVELADAELNMAMAADQMNQKELAMHLYEMGKETFTHAECIKHDLKDFGKTLDETEYQKYKNLEARIERFFS